MGSVLIWYFAVTLIGWVSFPIAFVALKHFPDKGYAFSKVLGLVLMGYLYWALGYAACNSITLMIAFIIMVGLSATLLVTWIRKPFVEFIKKNLAFFVLMEALFLMAFVVAGAYKMRTPDILGTEKPMDFAFINGILSSPSMPPQDPWLAGGSISYYYFGYFIVAMLCRITQVTPGEAFNLMIAMTWAASILGAFSLGYALTRRYRYSLLSAACLAVFGNLDYWHRAVQSFLIGNLDAPYYNRPIDPNAARGLAGLFGYLVAPLRHGWDYFQASRIIPVSSGDKMITEFPAFSFFLSDLHPHVMGIPLVLLSLALGFNLLLSNQPGLRVFSGNGTWRWAQLVLVAMVLGAMDFMNVADFTTFLGFFVLCLLLQQWWANEEGWQGWVKSVVLVGGPLIVLSVLFYLPFYSKYQSQVQGIGLVTDRTNLYYLFVMFGFFLVVLIPALVSKALRLDKVLKPKAKKVELLQCAICGHPGSGKKFCGDCGGELFSAGSEVTPIPDDSFRGMLSKVSSWAASSSNGWILAGTIVAVLLLTNLPPVRMAVLLSGFLVIVVCLIALASASESRTTVFSVILVFTAFLIIWGCEVVYVKDLFSGDLYRMNSVFKYYYHVWILLSVAMAPWAKWLMENLWGSWERWKKTVWAGLAGLALFGAAIYPLLAFSARIQGTSSDAATMDGALYYERYFPDNYAAAQWIRQNVKPVAGKVPVILEAWGESYAVETKKSGGRVAMMTGYPTVLGWNFHEVQWHGTWDHTVIRGGQPDDTINQRQTDIDTIYTSMDLNQTKQLLGKYKVEYVYVGDAEKEKYRDHLDAMGKFAQLGTVAFQQGSAVLYKLNP